VIDFFYPGYKQPCGFIKTSGQCEPERRSGCSAERSGCYAERSGCSDWVFKGSFPPANSNHLTTDKNY